MLLAPFRQKQVHVFPLVALYALGFVLSGAADTSQETSPTTYRGGFLQFLIQLAEGQSYWAWTGFLLLCLLQAFLLNNLADSYKLSRRPSYIPAISYLLCLFILPNSGQVSAALLANFPLLIAMVSLFQAYDKKNSVKDVFNGAFCISLAALIYAPLWWQLPIYLLIWLSLRSFNAKELIIVLSGFFVPVFLLGTYWYVNNGFADWWQRDIAGYWGMMRLGLSWNIPTQIGLSILGVLLLALLWNMPNLKAKTLIREQKFINVLYWFLLGSGLSLLWQKNIEPIHLHCLALPMGLLLGLSLQAMRSEKQAAWLHFFLWLLLMLVQYWNWIDGDWLRAYFNF